MGKTKKAKPYLKWLTPQAAQAKPHGGQDIENSLSEPHAELLPRPQKGSNKQFFFFKIPDLVHRQKLPPDGAVDFTLQQ